MFGVSTDITTRILLVDNSIGFREHPQDVLNTAGGLEAKREQVGIDLQMENHRRKQSIIQLRNSPELMEQVLLNATRGRPPTQMPARLTTRDYSASGISGILQWWRGGTGV